MPKKSVGRKATTKQRQKEKEKEKEARRTRTRTRVSYIISCKLLPSQFYNVSEQCSPSSSEMRRLILIPMTRTAGTVYNLIAHTYVDCLRSNEEKHLVFSFLRWNRIQASRKAQLASKQVRLEQVKSSTEDHRPPSHHAQPPVSTSTGGNAMSPHTFHVGYVQ